MTKYIYIALAGVVVVLIGVLRYQSGVIEDLETTKAQQAETIIQQSTKITQLESDIAENQRITFELSKAESKAREEQNAIINSIPNSDKQSNAYNSVAPISLLNFLRK
ncbi:MULTISPECIES: DUF2570 domain-containing protein [Haemophilus]|uniref:DUF2570 domain-containing protein n=1 Tax=Haemophilus TaxID=724 RepID=UPI00059B4DAC|nr:MULTISPECIES: DUF2570 domain-containing protein [Haemophilus]MBZ5691050.1 hypothetical protein [Haemophilus influenzae]MCK8838648.1 DUF2570 domain-containing protein [Haemophilus influenzae]MCK8947122.1 DUF2570 domain-containing protein [Haemophilus influenzae]MCK9006115.1 DUF2570 domain-containing protein [Haemophilus influenzae]MCK9026634.1 DUF2570 domain-containing protein [Haemophilus influenzae]